MEEGSGLRASMEALAMGDVGGLEAQATSADGHGRGRWTTSSHGGLGDGQTTMEDGG
jgi:hypothetical protein